MATIDLKNGYRLQSDKRQWMIQKRGKDVVDKEGVSSEFWKSTGYYTTLSGAVVGAYELFLKESDAVGITEFMVDSKRIFNKMVDCLSPVMKITEK